jgi:hypothetical protein
MRKSLLAITALMLSAFGAPAQQSGLKQSDRAAPSGKTLPLKGASSANSCAAYGPGFVKVEGTGTCVQVGGSVIVGVGTSRSAR